MGLSIVKQQKVDVIAQLERMIANDKFFTQEQREQFGAKKLEMVESLMELKITPANKVQVALEFETEYRSYVDVAKKELISKENAQKAIKSEEGGSPTASPASSPTVGQKVLKMFGLGGKSSSYSSIDNNPDDDSSLKTAKRKSV